MEAVQAWQLLRVWITQEATCQDLVNRPHLESLHWGRWGRVVVRQRRQGSASAMPLVRLARQDAAGCAGSSGGTSSDASTSTWEASDRPGRVGRACSASMRGTGSSVPHRNSLSFLLNFQSQLENIIFPKRQRLTCMSTATGCQGG